MGKIGLGDDHCASGIFVEPVDNPRPLDTTDTGEGTMGEEGVNEGTGSVSSRGMNYHPSRFIDNNQVFVFVEEIQRDRFWDQIESCR